MRDNWGLSLTGTTCRLVPYQRKHVARYHAWMEDAQLREDTASERLTLEEEMAMQAEWRDDGGKCTFIVVLPDGAVPDPGADEAMVGDINLFFPGGAGDRAHAELMVMTADPRARRKGIAAEAVALVMRYGAARLRVERFFVKISEGNAPSLALFEALGYVEKGHFRCCCCCCCCCY